VSQEELSLMQLVLDDLENLRRGFNTMTLSGKLPQGCGVNVLDIVGRHITLLDQLTQSCRIGEPANDLAVGELPRGRVNLWIEDQDGKAQLLRLLGHHFA
jgi:hypothetical protein